MEKNTGLRRCPTCGSMMVGEKFLPDREEFDRFSCLSCGAVVDLSRKPDDDSRKLR